MPRVYQRSPGNRRYADYSPQILEEALKSVRNGMSKVVAAQTYGIPVRTIYNKLKTGVEQRKPGGQTKFTCCEETRFKNNLMALADFGLAVDRDCLRIIVRDYLNKIKRTVPQFVDNVPGIDWCYGFEKRHKDLAYRGVRSTTSDRSKVEETDLKSYIEELKIMLEGVEPDAMYNFDETNLSDDPGKKSIYFCQTRKYPELICNHSKACISLMLCGNAAEDVLPPYVVYKSKHLWDSWKTGGPPGTMYDNSKLGWFEGVTFSSWFKNMFLCHVRRPHSGKKVVLIGDNLSLHFDKDVIELCKKYNIAFVCLPANS